MTVEGWGWNNTDDAVRMVYELLGGDSPSMVEWKIVWESGGLVLALQWFLFIFAAIFQTEKFYDAGGSLGFLLAVWHSFPGFPSPFVHESRRGAVANDRQWLASILVTVWTVRLGAFLFFRVLKLGEDARFAKVKYQPQRFFIFWTVQALWVFFTSLPVLIINASDTASVPSFGSVPVVDWGGLGLWTAGFLLECVADYQKFVFKSEPHNEGKWISHGVYSWCRHPNYFGEMVLWIGAFLLVSPALTQMHLLVAMLSPTFVILLITFVSGVPILERNAQRKYGKNPAFQEYKNRTPLLIPFLGSRG